MDSKAKRKPKKLTRAELLTLEAELAVLEEQYDELKRQRPRCSKCHRLEVTGGHSIIDKKIRAAGVQLREKRQHFREQRALSAPAPNPVKTVVEVPDGS